MTDAATLDYAAIVPADEYLHPVPPGTHFTAVETNYFGFNCADAGLDGHLYMWFHPALGVMMADLFLYRGILGGQLSADYHNHVNYLPMPRDVDDYEITMGSCHIHISVIEPLQKIAFKITDPKAGLAIDWLSIAAGPPVGRPGGGHFTQLMRNEGTLVLRGEHLPINGNFIRDRSFNYFRTEDAQLGPPYNWITGWWKTGQAFHCTILDTSIFPQPEFGPDWHLHVGIGDASKTMIWEKAGAKTPSLNLRYGWWLENGEVRHLKSVRNRTILAPGTTRPVGAELEILDETGATHHVIGTVRSHVLHYPIMNNENSVCFMDWELAGEIGHGNLEVVYTNQHLRNDRWRTGA
jgi:hypothetical protein